ncbi:phosphoenolpyruvate mutase [Dulcicalothrix desertica PCC 7102]|uniref:phosphoenolpyruvate mutase n=1 Tax=Dulcicalothrix desertica PCC 7102 TaxID=232991 RepID=A0A3S1CNF6_9CYAN|nr:phosphoenolpyruvate mutase [Dulcicalothrix desertica]RUT07241.1 phosphoenolpyruvate mutase [Dulcicalothrix desertica PCC 7102]TWH61765.1 phosphoenolpyruvate mutase [Dulcicalothrix desertica PCC 7102]
MRKTTALKNLLKSESLEFLMESHNAISAKIVEEAGFKGIWASGLSISAQLGVRDNNEASWTQVLEVIEFMSDCTSIPILLDGDTGYGNFNNVQRLVKKLEQRNIAGVCIEDKLFPKTNSFINGAAQPLADIQEFCGKIKAAKDAQTDDDFVVIARVEALIAGWGLPEALMRAEEYHQAGADGILIHSSKQTAEEILEFKREWGARCPVVIVPTKYYTTPVHVFRDYKFSIAIWANQMLRTAITAMKQMALNLAASENILVVEESIVSVAEVFRLQGATELLEAEKRYLPCVTDSVSVTLLAASRGIELGELTLNLPKCMLNLSGKPILGRIVETYQTVGIKDITVVRGYKKDMVNLPGLRYVDNDEYDNTGELFSLYKGLADVTAGEKDWIIGYGDVLYKKYVLQMLLEVKHDLVVVVDSKWSDRPHQVRPDYVMNSLPNSQQTFYTDVYFKQIAPEMPVENRCGIWTGLLKVSRTMQPVLWDTLKMLLQQDEMTTIGRMPALLNELTALGYPIHVIYITSDWLDVDEVQDMITAGSF